MFVAASNVSNGSNETCPSLFAPTKCNYDIEWSPVKMPALTEPKPIDTKLKGRVSGKLVDRYGPYAFKPSLETQIAALSIEQRAMFASVKAIWREQVDTQRPNQQPQPAWTDDLILRVTDFCDFDLEDSVEMLRRMRPEHWNDISTAQLAMDLKSQAVMPLPGVTTQGAKDVVYMYPARLVEKSCTDPIRLVTFVLNCMYDRYESANKKCKVAFLINLQDYKLSLSCLGVDEWISLLELLQGQNGPLRATRVLLVNPSADFTLLWKSQLQEHCLHWRLCFIPSNAELEKYLRADSALHLPEDFPQGRALVKELVRDFVSYRQSLEYLLQLQCRADRTRLSLNKNQEIESDSEVSDRLLAMHKHRRDRPDGRALSFRKVRQKNPRILLVVPSGNNLPEV